MTDVNCREVSKDVVELIPIECSECGGHVGIDASYASQVGEVLKVTCPYCLNPMEVDCRD
jgi:hypothetical protein